MGKDDKEKKELLNSVLEMFHRFMRYDVPNSDNLIDLVEMMTQRI